MTANVAFLSLLYFKTILKWEGHGVTLFKIKHFTSLLVTIFACHSQCQTDRDNVQSAKCGKQFQSCLLCQVQGSKSQEGAMSRAHLELRWVLHLLCFLTLTRSFLESPGPWLLYSSCSSALFSFALSFDQFGRKHLLSPRAEGSEPWAAQVWSCRLPGSFAVCKDMVYPPPHPFQSFPSWLTEGTCKVCRNTLKFEHK